MNNSFGQPNNTMNNSFGQPNNTTNNIFSASTAGNSTPFGVANNASTLFNKNENTQQSSSASLFGNPIQPTSNLFSSSNNTVQSNPMFGSSNIQPTSNLFSSNNNTVQPTSNLFSSNNNTGQPTSNLFSSNNNTVQPTSNLFSSNNNTVQPNNLFNNNAQSTMFGNNTAGESTMMNNVTSNHIGSTQQQSTSNLFGTMQNTKQEDSVIDQSTLISSMKDNSVNLYNLTLQEVIDRHSSILESNIKEFEKDAQNIFQRDLQLIKNKNNYIAIQKKLEEENVKLDELSQVLDFFDERLNEIEMGEVNPSVKIIEDFEAICDKFYKKIENFKDEQDEVLDLVNENYEIIENIDKKLDMLEKVRNIK